MSARLVYDTNTVTMTPATGRVAVQVRSMPLRTTLEGVLLIASATYSAPSPAGDTTMTNESGVGVLELRPGAFSIHASFIGYFGGAVPVVVRAGMMDSLHLAMDHQAICN